MVIIVLIIVRTRGTVPKDMVDRLGNSNKYLNH